MRDDPAAGMMRSRPRTDAELRIFCFTSAGSGASVFFSWFRGLDANFELFPYQLPGREDRRSEAAFRRMGPLVAAVVDDLTGRSEVPYALFGHSLGALIAFEVAREVRRRGLPPPVHLFASARIAPQLGLRQSPIHHFFPKTSTQQFIQVISNELAKSRSDGPPRERSSAEFARKC